MGDASLKAADRRRQMWQVADLQRLCHPGGPVEAATTSYEIARGSHSCFTNIDVYDGSCVRCASQACGACSECYKLGMRPLQPDRSRTVAFCYPTA